MTNLVGLSTSKIGLFLLLAVPFLNGCGNVVNLAVFSRYPRPKVKLTSGTFPTYFVGLDGKMASRPTGLIGTVDAATQSISFPEAPFGSTLGATLSLFNRGDAPADHPRINSATNPFEIPSEGNLCQNLKQLDAVGGNNSCTFEIRFHAPTPNRLSELKPDGKNFSGEFSLTYGLGLDPSTQEERILTASYPASGKSAPQPYLRLIPWPTADSRTFVTNRNPILSNPDYTAGFLSLGYQFNGDRLDDSDPEKTSFKNTYLGSSTPAGWITHSSLLGYQFSDQISGDEIANSIPSPCNRSPCPLSPALSFAGLDTTTPNRIRLRFDPTATFSADLKPYLGLGLFEMQIEILNQSNSMPISGPISLYIVGQKPKTNPPTFPVGSSATLATVSPSPGVSPIFIGGPNLNPDLSWPNLSSGSLPNYEFASSYQITLYRTPRASPSPMQLCSSSPSPMWSVEDRTRHKSTYDLSYPAQDTPTQGTQNLIFSDPSDHRIHLGKSALEKITWQPNSNYYACVRAIDSFGNRSSERTALLVQPDVRPVNEVSATVAQIDKNAHGEGFVLTLPGNIQFSTLEYGAVDHYRAYYWNDDNPIQRCNADHQSRNYLTIRPSSGDSITFHSNLDDPSAAPSPVQRITTADDPSGYSYSIPYAFKATELTELYPSSLCIAVDACNSSNDCTPPQNETPPIPIAQPSTKIEWNNGTPTYTFGATGLITANWTVGGKIRDCKPSSSSVPSSILFSTKISEKLAIYSNPSPLPSWTGAETQRSGCTEYSFTASDSHAANSGAGVPSPNPYAYTLVSPTDLVERTDNSKASSEDTTLDFGAHSFGFGTNPPEEGSTLTTSSATINIIPMPTNVSNLDTYQIEGWRKINDSCANRPATAGDIHSVQFTKNQALPTSIDFVKPTAEGGLDFGSCEQISGDYCIGLRACNAGRTICYAPPARLIRRRPTGTVTIASEAAAGSYTSATDPAPVSSLGTFSVIGATPSGTPLSRNYSWNPRFTATSTAPITNYQVKRVVDTAAAANGFSAAPDFSSAAAPASITDLNEGDLQTATYRNASCSGGSYTYHLPLASASETYASIASAKNWTVATDYRYHRVCYQLSATAGGSPQLQVYCHTFHHDAPSVTEFTQINTPVGDFNPYGKVQWSWTVGSKIKSEASALSASSIDIQRIFGTNWNALNDANPSSTGRSDYHSIATPSANFNFTPIGCGGEAVSANGPWCYQITAPDTSKATTVETTDITDTNLRPDTGGSGQFQSDNTYQPFTGSRKIRYRWVMTPVAGTSTTIAADNPTAFAASDPAGYPGALSLTHGAPFALASATPVRDLGNNPASDRIEFVGTPIHATASQFASPDYQVEAWKKTTASCDHASARDVQTQSPAFSVNASGQLTASVTFNSLGFTSTADRIADYCTNLVARHATVGAVSAFLARTNTLEVHRIGSGSNAIEAVAAATGITPIIGASFSPVPFASGNPTVRHWAWDPQFRVSSPRVLSQINVYRVVQTQDAAFPASRPADAVYNSVSPITSYSTPAVSTSGTDANQTLVRLKNGTHTDTLPSASGDQSNTASGLNWDDANDFAYHQVCYRIEAVPSDGTSTFYQDYCQHFHTDLPHVVNEPTISNPVSSFNQNGQIQWSWDYGATVRSDGFPLTASNMSLARSVTVTSGGGGTYTLTPNLTSVDCANPNAVVTGFTPPAAGPWCHRVSLAETSAATGMGDELHGGNGFDTNSSYRSFSGDRTFNYTITLTRPGGVNYGTPVSILPDTLLDNSDLFDGSGINTFRLSSATYTSGDANSEKITVSGVPIKASITPRTYSIEAWKLSAGATSCSNTRSAATTIESQTITSPNLDTVMSSCSSGDSFCSVDVLFNGFGFNGSGDRIANYCIGLSVCRTSSSGTQICTQAQNPTLVRRQTNTNLTLQAQSAATDGTPGTFTLQSSTRSDNSRTLRTFVWDPTFTIHAGLRLESIEIERAHFHVGGVNHDADTDQDLENYGPIVNGIFNSTDIYESTTSGISRTLASSTANTDQITLHLNTTGSGESSSVIHAADHEWNDLDNFELHRVCYKIKVTPEDRGRDPITETYCQNRDLRNDAPTVTFDSITPRAYFNAAGKIQWRWPVGATLQSKTSTLLSSDLTLNRVVSGTSQPVTLTRSSVSCNSPQTTLSTEPSQGPWCYRVTATTTETSALSQIGDTPTSALAYEADTAYTSFSGSKTVQYQTSSTYLSGLSRTSTPFTLDNTQTLFSSLTHTYSSSNDQVTFSWQAPPSPTVEHYYKTEVWKAAAGGNCVRTSASPSPIPSFTWTPSPNETGQPTKQLSFNDFKKADSSNAYSSCNPDRPANYCVKLLMCRNSAGQEICTPDPAANAAEGDSITRASNGTLAITLGSDGSDGSPGNFTPSPTSSSLSTTHLKRLWKWDPTFNITRTTASLTEVTIQRAHISNDTSLADLNSVAPTYSPTPIASYIAADITQRPLAGDTCGNTYQMHLIKGSAPATDRGETSASYWSFDTDHKFQKICYKINVTQESDSTVYTREYCHTFDFSSENPVITFASPSPSPVSYFNSAGKIQWQWGARASITSYSSSLTEGDLNIYRSWIKGGGSSSEQSSAVALHPSVTWSPGANNCSAAGDSCTGPWTYTASFDDNSAAINAAEASGNTASANFADLQNSTPTPFENDPSYIPFAGARSVQYSLAVKPLSGGTEIGKTDATDPFWVSLTNPSSFSFSLDSGAYAASDQLTFSATRLQATCSHSYRFEAWEINPGTTDCTNRPGPGDSPSIKTKTFTSINPSDTTSFTPNFSDFTSVTSATSFAHRIGDFCFDLKACRPGSSGGTEICTSATGTRAVHRYISTNAPTVTALVHPSPSPSVTTVSGRDRYTWIWNPKFSISSDDLVQSITVTRAHLLSNTAPTDANFATPTASYSPISSIYSLPSTGPGNFIVRASGAQNDVITMHAKTDGTAESSSAIGNWSDADYFNFHKICYRVTATSRGVSTTQDYCGTVDLSNDQPTLTLISPSPSPVTDFNSSGKTRSTWALAARVFSPSGSLIPGDVIFKRKVASASTPNWSSIAQNTVASPSPSPVSVASCNTGATYGWCYEMQIPDSTSQLGNEANVDSGTWPNATYSPFAPGDRYFNYQASLLGGTDLANLATVQVRNGTPFGPLASPTVTPDATTPGNDRFGVLASPMPVSSSRFGSPAYQIEVWRKGSGNCSRSSVADADIFRPSAALSYSDIQNGTSIPITFSDLKNSATAGLTSTADRIADYCVNVRAHHAGTGSDDFWVASSPQTVYRRGTGTPDVTIAAGSITGAPREFDYSNYVSPIGGRNVRHFTWNPSFTVKSPYTLSTVEVKRFFASSPTIPAPSSSPDSNCSGCTNLSIYASPTPSSPANALNEMTLNLRSSDTLTTNQRNSTTPFYTGDWTDGSVTTPSGQQNGLGWNDASNFDYNRVCYQIKATPTDPTASPTLGTICQNFHNDAPAPSYSFSPVTSDFNQFGKFQFGWTLNATIQSWTSSLTTGDVTLKRNVTGLISGASTTSADVNIASSPSPTLTPVSCSDLTTTSSSSNPWCYKLTAADNSFANSGESGHLDTGSDFLGNSDTYTTYSYDPSHTRQIQYRLLAALPASSGPTSQPLTASDRSLATITPIPSFTVSGVTYTSATDQIAFSGQAMRASGIRSYKIYVWKQTGAGCQTSVPASSGANPVVASPLPASSASPLPTGIPIGNFFNTCTATQDDFQQNYCTALQACNNAAGTGICTFAKNASGGQAISSFFRTRSNALSITATPGGAIGTFHTPAVSFSPGSSDDSRTWNWRIPITVSAPSRLNGDLTLQRVFYTPGAPIADSNGTTVPSDWASATQVTLSPLNPSDTLPSGCQQNYIYSATLTGRSTGLWSDNGATVRSPRICYKIRATLVNSTSLDHYICRTFTIEPQFNPTATWPSSNSVTVNLSTGTAKPMVVNSPAPVASYRAQLWNKSSVSGGTCTPSGSFTPSPILTSWIAGSSTSRNLTINSGAGSCFDKHRPLCVQVDACTGAADSTCTNRTGSIQELDVPTYSSSIQPTFNPTLAITPTRDPDGDDSAAAKAKWRWRLKLDQITSAIPITGIQVWRKVGEDNPSLIGTISTIPQFTFTAPTCNGNYGSPIYTYSFAQPGAGTTCTTDASKGLFCQDSSGLSNEAQPTDTLIQYQLRVATANDPTTYNVQGTLVNPSGSTTPTLPYLWLYNSPPTQPSARPAFGLISGSGTSGSPFQMKTLSLKLTGTCDAFTTSQAGGSANTEVTVTEGATIAQSSSDHVKNLSATCSKTSTSTFSETSSEFRNRRSTFNFDNTAGILTVTANLKDNSNVPFTINIKSTDRWNNSSIKIYYFNNNFSCPTGFVGVPSKNINASVADFCVSQYQMTYQSSGEYHEFGRTSSQVTCRDNYIAYSTRPFFKGSWGNLFNNTSGNFGTTSIEPPLRISLGSGEFISGIFLASSFSGYRCGQTYNDLSATNSAQCTSYPSSGDRTISFLGRDINFAFCTQEFEATAADFACKGYGDRLNFGTSTYSNFALLTAAEWNNISNLAGDAASQTGRDLQNGQTIYGFNGALALNPITQWTGAAQREITYGVNGTNVLKGTTPSTYYGIRCTYRP